MVTCAGAWYREDDDFNDPVVAARTMRDLVFNLLVSPLLWHVGVWLCEPCC